MVVRDAPAVSRAGTASPVARGPSWESAYRRGVLMVDAFAALFATVPCVVLRPDVDGGLRTGTAYTAALAVVPVLWVLTLSVVGNARRHHFRNLRDDFRDVVVAVAALLAVVAVLTLALEARVPRVAVLILLLSAATTLAGRAWAGAFLRAMRRRGRCLHRILAVGQPSAVRALIDELSRARTPAAVVVGCCVPGSTRGEALLPSSIRVYHGTDAVVPAAEFVGADVVAVLPCPELPGTVLRRLAWAMEGRAWHLLVIPGLTDVEPPRLAVGPIGELSVVHLSPTRTAGPRWIVKLVVEWLLALVAVLVTAPLLVAVAAVVRVTSPGPVLFRQIRVGRRGRLFPCLKFRTMVVGAEHRRHKLGGDNINADGLLFKVRGDPRITRVGAALRRWSLDELPQLFNILAGQMALVGPRPALPVEAVRYDDDVRRRLLVKPGLTGLWQISGRSDLPWHDAVRLDLRYVDNWSLSLDAMIISRTATAVLRRAGAY